MFFVLETGLSLENLLEHLRGENVDSFELYMFDQVIC